MGITSKSKSENWGMGFLLVFFPEDQQHPLPLTAATSSSPFKPTVSSMRRVSSNHFLTKTQSTISICALLFFLSLLLFTLEPTPTNHLTPRRLLLSQAQITKLPSFALQKMGVLHRRGTKGMHDLIVGHVTESLSLQDLRVFLRLYHFSNFSSKSDLVLIFPSNLDAFESIIFEEIKSFSRQNSSQFVKSSKKEEEPLWGKKSRSGNYTITESTRPGSNNSTENELTQSIESTKPGYGSVVSFMAEELDPENSLSGFIDHLTMGMHRWACYPMLLGRVKRNFKHIILLDVKEILLLGDPLSRIRTRSPEWVQLSTDSSLENIRHGKKHSTELVTHKRVNSAMVLGGARGVRRLANAMLTEIVRASTATQHKKKNSVTELAIFNQLAGNENLLKSVNVNSFTESVPDLSSLAKINSNSGLGFEKYTVVRRGSSNIDVNSVIRKHICSSLRVHSSVYNDC